MTCYFGPLDQASSYFDDIQYSIPLETNPAEFYLELINTDLATEGDEVFERIKAITRSWSEGKHAELLQSEIASINSRSHETDGLDKVKLESAGIWQVLTILLWRSWTKATRDIVAYGIRIVMYLGLAILMGTVFLRFGDNQKYIQPYTNALFFGGAFMSFMAVAYVPAFLEDRATFVMERANGLVGPFTFILSNFVIGLPFLFLIAVLFSVVTYFMIDFRQTGGGFWIYTAWLFLDLLAAESLVVFVASIFPIFVVALAVTAFANGLWMCVDGFLVPLTILNPFWKYVFHYIDYQAYVFQGMMVNQFRKGVYKCDRVGSSFSCQYPSPLNVEGKIDGGAVLNALKITVGRKGEWFGIMVGIIAVYRILAYLALRLRR
jgi:ABC-type multidrug transport system permease subunit